MWKIKHLIKIEPITFPYGEPTENDVNHTYLKENGECLVVKEIGKNFNKRLEATEVAQKDAKQLYGENLRRDSRLRWDKGWLE